MAGSGLALRQLWATSTTRRVTAHLKLAIVPSAALGQRPLPLCVGHLTQCCGSARRACASGPSAAVSPGAMPPLPPAPPQPAASSTASSTKFHRERLLDGEEEVLTEAEKLEKDQIVKELTRRLSGPLADEHGNVPTGKERPIAIEVDGPSHFYANSKRYTAYTKLKHRLLTRMGYKVLHVPYYDWRRLRGAKEREEYMKTKLQEEPSEWLDPEDEKYYNAPPGDDEEEFSVKPSATAARPLPSTPPPSPARTVVSSEEKSAVREQSTAAARGHASGPGVPPPPPRPPQPPSSAILATPTPAVTRAAAPPPPPRPSSKPPVLSGLDRADQRRGTPPPPPRPKPPSGDSAKVLHVPSFPSK